MKYAYFKQKYASKVKRLFFFICFFSIMTFHQEIPQNALEIESLRSPGLWYNWPIVISFYKSLVVRLLCKTLCNKNSRYH